MWSGWKTSFNDYNLSVCKLPTSTVCWDHVTLRLQTGGLYLANYVTSEGNWLHQILFRGFIAKGVNTYAHTTFPFFFLEFFETSYFTSPIWTILCMSMAWNSNKNLFKLQVVMQEKLVKMPRGMNTFARCRMCQNFENQLRESIQPLVQA